MIRKIYIAAPLFSEADRAYNKMLYDEFVYLPSKKIGMVFNEKLKITVTPKNPNLDIYLPQLNDAINDKRNFASSIPIFDGDTDHLKETDILIALLDGTVVDPGVAAEVGYFASLCEQSNGTKKIFALFTDCRDATTTPAGESMNKKADYMNREICESQFPYINLYLVGAIKKYGKICGNTDDLLKTVQEYLDSLDD